ncbi:MAG: fimbrillin family protein [Bacteroidales bacterium]|nr:fimbrillin family protein [Bacteroidales bacterium]
MIERRQIWLWAAALAAMALIACSCAKVERVGDEDPEWNGLTGDMPVRFSSGVSTKTTTGLPDDATMGVFAYYTKTSNWSTSAKPNFMFNQLVEGDDTDSDGYSDVWTYSPLKYWPNTTNHKVTFWAYSPYDANVALFNAGANTTYTNDSKGIPDIRFTVTDGKTDFMTSDRINNRTKPSLSTPVSFTFQHALSLVDFTVEKVDDTDAFEVILTSITLESMYKTGINRSDAWRNYSGALGSLTAFSGSQTVTTTETVVTDSGVMPIPQVLVRPIQGDEVKLRVIYTLQARGTSTVKTDAHLLALTGTWERGKHYTYKIKITPDLPIEFTVSWTDWGSVDNYHLSN